jgi:hypothetical protein
MEIPAFQAFDNEVDRYLSGILRDNEVWAEECHPATNGQQIDIDLKETDGSAAFGGDVAAVRVCGTSQEKVSDACTDLQKVRGTVFTAPNHWYVGEVSVIVTAGNDKKQFMRKFCIPRSSEDRWAGLKWWAPSYCRGGAAPAAPAK